MTTIIEDYISGFSGGDEIVLSGGEYEDFIGGGNDDGDEFSDTSSIVININGNIPDKDGVDDDVEEVEEDSVEGYENFTGGDGSMYDSDESVTSGTDDGDGDENVVLDIGENDDEDEFAIKTDNACDTDEIQKGSDFFISGGSSNELEFMDMFQIAFKV